MRKYEGPTHTLVGDGCMDLNSICYGYFMVLANFMSFNDDMLGLIKFTGRVDSMGYKSIEYIHQKHRMLTVFKVTTSEHLFSIFR